MSGTVVYKIRSPVKRVIFEEKPTTRGIRFRQHTVKAKPLRSPSKRTEHDEAESFDHRGFDNPEPLIHSHGKVS